MAGVDHNVITSKYGTVLAKTESTYGTDPTPTTAANAICVWDIAIKKTQMVGEPDCVKADADATHFVPAGAYWDISFKMALTGSGEVAGGDVREPAVSPLLKSSRFSATDGTSIWTYAPNTLGRTGSTLYIYLGSVKDAAAGNLYKFNGFQGHCKLVLDPANGYGIWEVEGKAIFNAVSNSAAPTADYYELAPPTCVGLTATIAGTAYTIRKLALDNVVEIGDGLQIGAPGAFGYGYFQAMRGHTVLEMTVDALQETAGAGSYTFYAAQQAATELAISVTALGAVTGNTWAIVIPKAVITELSESEASAGLKTYDLICKCKRNASTGNDSFSITVQ